MTRTPAVGATLLTFANDLVDRDTLEKREATAISQNLPITNGGRLTIGTRARSYLYRHIRLQQSTRSNPLHI